MRRARILGELSAEANSYHLMSRVIEGRFVFDELGKERFRELLEAYAEMAGIEIFTWCCMSNHFHLLVEVPNAEMGRAALDDEEILRRLGLVMKKRRLSEVRQMLELMKKQSPNHGYREYRERLLARMFDVSVFMREIKQRFAQWHNKRVKRKGPLFEDRFKSVLLEDDEGVLLTMAAYIDLNPVRAGMVRDPKDYRWSGYGEAVAGKASRRAGLMRIYGDDSGDGRKWRRYQSWYRSVLYEAGEQSEASPSDEDGGARGRRRLGVSPSAAERVRRQRGQLKIAQVTRVRVRYFTESLAFGSREWVEEVFARNREKMRVKRKHGARKPGVEGLGDWRGLIDLRNRAWDLIN
jgi:REP element-mobilizing transposase RayT